MNDFPKMITEDELCKSITGSHITSISIDHNDEIIVCKDKYSTMVNILNELKNSKHDVVKNYNGNFEDAQNHLKNLKHILKFAEDKKLHIKLVIFKDNQTKCYEKYYGIMTPNQIKSTLEKIKSDQHEQKQQIDEQKQQIDEQKQQIYTLQKYINVIYYFIILFVIVTLVSFIDFSTVFPNFLNVIFSQIHQHIIPPNSFGLAS